MNVQTLKEAKELSEKISIQTKLISNLENLSSRFNADKKNSKFYLYGNGNPHSVVLDSDIAESAFVQQMQREEKKMAMLRKQFDEL